MKKITGLLLLLLPFFLQAQNLENSKWLIGRELALIDFNTPSGTQAVPLPPGVSTTVGGLGLPASVSDQDGDLLFYVRANGARVFDRNYTAVNAFPNLLRGAMGSLIVPVPGSNNSKYLIFSNDHRSSGAQVPSNHFYWSVINVTPSGEVTVVPSKVNRQLLWNIRPNMTSFYNPHDGKPYIVVFGQNDSDTDASTLNDAENTLYIYRVDDEDTIVQVEKQHFPYLDETAHFWDEIKVSPDVTKIGFNFKLVAPGKDDVFLLDLSVSCGNASVSNFTPLFNTTNGAGTGNSGFEFSPDSQLFYTADVSGVYQSDGLGSITRLTPNGAEYRSGTGLQRGIDDKIYVSHRNNTYLDVIERPNEIGTNANYVNEALPFQREGLTSNHLPALVPVLRPVDICQEDPCPDCIQSGIDILNSISPLLECGAYQISVRDQVAECYDISVNLGNGDAPIQLNAGITTLTYTVNGTYEATLSLSQNGIECFTRKTEVVIDCFQDCIDCNGLAESVIQSITPTSVCGMFEITTPITDGCYRITATIDDGTIENTLPDGTSTFSYSANDTYNYTINVSDQDGILCDTSSFIIDVSCFDTCIDCIWPRTYGSSTGVYSYRFSNTVLVDNDENVYTMGSSLMTGDTSHEDSTFSKGQGAYVMSHDAQGNLRWIQYFDQDYTENSNIGARFEMAHDGVVLLTDKGYLAKYSFDGTLVFGFIATDNVYTDFTPSIMEVDEITGDIYISRMRINDGHLLKKYSATGQLIDTYDYIQAAAPPLLSGVLIGGFDVVGERNLIIITGFTNTEVVLENGMSFWGNYVVEVNISNNDIQINIPPMSLLPYSISKVGYDLTNDIIYFDKTRNSSSTDLSFIGYTQNSLYNTQNIIFIGHDNAHASGHTNIDQQTGNVFMKDGSRFYHLKNGSLVWELHNSDIQTIPRDIMSKNGHLYITGSYGNTSNAFGQHFPGYGQGSGRSIYITQTNNTPTGPMGFVDGLPNEETTAEKEQEGFSTIKAFPNPFSDTFYIKSATEKNIKRIEVFNAYGLHILSQKYTIGQTIQLQKGAPGLYFVKVYMKDGSMETLQLIKK